MYHLFTWFILGGAIISLNYEFHIWSLTHLKNPWLQFFLISYIPCFQTSSHKSYSRNSFIFGVYHFLIKITPLLHEYVNDVNENSSYTEIPTSSYKKPGAREHPKQSVIHSWSFNSIYQRKIVSIILSQLQKLNRKMPAGKIIYYFFLEMLFISSGSFSGTARFACPVCFSSYSSQYALQAHMQSHRR